MSLVAAVATTRDVALVADPVHLDLVTKKVSSRFNKTVTSAGSPSAVAGVSDWNGITRLSGTGCADSAKERVVGVICRQAS
jgi:hypothetical protein